MLIILDVLQKRHQLGYYTTNSVLLRMDYPTEMYRVLITLDVFYRPIRTITLSFLAFFIGSHVCESENIFPLNRDLKVRAKSVFSCVN